MTLRDFVVNYLLPAIVAPLVFAWAMDALVDWWQAKRVWDYEMRWLRQRADLRAKADIEWAEVWHKRCLEKQLKQEHDQEREAQEREA